MDIAALAELLHETAEHHDRSRRPRRRTTGGTGTPPTSARGSRGHPEEADAAADRYMAEVKHVVATSR